MRVFLTGATGFIGSALVPELLDAGHQVLGLARSDASAESLVAVGAQVHRGRLEDLSSLRIGAAHSDAVIHCAYDHDDLSKLEESQRKESRAIDALGAELIGTGRPLVITSVTALGAAAPGKTATEDYYNPKHPNPRISTENAAADISDWRVNMSVVRLPQVHNTIKQGFVSELIRVAREKGISAYIGDGVNRWPAVHVLDAARLYRLVLEKGVPGTRYNAVAEEGIPLREIAKMIGKVLGVPVVSLSSQKAKSHFGWLTMFAGLDMPASSLQTQQLLGWHPTGAALFSDLEQVQPVPKATAAC